LRLLAGGDVDGRLYGRLTAERFDAMIAEQGRKKSDCYGLCAHDAAALSLGADEVASAMASEASSARC